MTFGSRNMIAALLVVTLAGIGCAGEDDDQRVLGEYEDTGENAAGDANVPDAHDPDASGSDADANGGTTDPDADNGGPDANNDPEDPDANNNDDICQPVGDGVIRRDQFPVATGFEVPYEFALDVQVDLQGEQIDGTTVWDLEEIDGDEFVEQLEIRDPEDYWFGDEFPEADYAVELSVQEDELGMYQVTDDELRLLGLATPHGPDSGEDHTNIEYDPPIDVLQFPLEEGDSWSVGIEAEGDYAEYASYRGHDESYDVQVDDAGEVITPYGTFDVLRVYTVREHPTLTFVWGWPTLTDVETRVVAFVAECFGTVARIISDEDENAPNFDEAAEVMRLTQ